MNGKPRPRYRPLPPVSVYLLGQFRSGLAALLILLVGVAIGVFGFRHFASLPWLDAILLSSMLLGGEGPTATLSTPAGKWFGSFYAVFGGVVLLTAVTVLLAPTIRRFLHRFHLEESYPHEPEPGGEAAPEETRRP